MNVSKDIFRLVLWTEIVTTGDDGVESLRTATTTSGSLGALPKGRTRHSGISLSLLAFRFCFWSLT